MPMIRSHAVQISPEILSFIAGIDEFKGAWRSLGTLAPDWLSALLRVATIESIGSSTLHSMGRVRASGMNEFSRDGAAGLIFSDGYLRIIRVNEPTIFVMENVKGLLSSKYSGDPIFENHCGPVRACGGPGV